MNTLAIMAAAISALPCASAAYAQTAGTYSGRTADGNSVSFTVGKAGTAGGLAVTAATIFFKAPCAGSSLVLNEGEGFGLSAAIVKNHAGAVVSHPSFWIGFSLNFTATGSRATGFVTAIGPYLPTGTAQPAKVYLCTSPKQAMAVTLQPAANAPDEMLQGASSSVYDRLGRVIGTTVR